MSFSYQYQQTPRRSITTFYKKEASFFAYPDILRLRGSVLANIIPYVLLVGVFSGLVCYVDITLGIKVGVSYYVGKIIPHLATLLYNT